MTLTEILDALFPAGHEVHADGQLVAGTARTINGTVAVLGTTDAAAIGHDIALGLAGRILDIVDQHPGRPIVFLVDTKGQALSRAEELLCLNGSLAHLARCVDLARRQGHVSVALVTGEAVSGGFLSFGLMADKTYALADAQVRVMDLKAMARVTKIAHERLVELAGSSPTFAPGAENYRRMGAIEAIWPVPSAALLEAALGQQSAAGPGVDGRMNAGLERGGRKLAAETVAAVLAA
ncbi:MAG: biotin-independent malonate decarboxylase subunit gamma [Zoogloea sp.]|nr:biotin-independent malonate decarboxylase subunit gamma [Zoogloea sp.]